MKVKVLFFSILSILFSTWSNAQTPDYVAKYINKYKNLAIREQQRTGIPAAVKLAQGLYETAFGKSELCLNANNHFGIKCKNYWTGETYTYTDDRKDECFRKYNNDSSSYIDHSDFLKTNKRYAGLFTLDVKDYSSWAKELKRCGYATNPNYAQKIIDLIERYNLQQYTIAAIPDYGDYGDFEDQLENNNDEPLKNYYIQSEKNGIKGFYAKKGDLLLNAAYKFNIRYTKLLEINDLHDEPLVQDMFIYLHKKNKTGSVSQYKFGAGDRLIAVAQEFGIRLGALREYNKLRAGEEPLVGRILSLNGLPPVKKEIQKIVSNIKEELPTKEKTKENTSNEEIVVEEPKNTLVTPDVAITPKTQEAYNIANEPAIEETLKAEKPESVTVNTPQIETQEIAIAVKEDKAPEEPMSDLDRLKAKLDKSVYGKKNSEAIITNKKEEKLKSKEVSEVSEKENTAVEEKVYVTRPAASINASQEQLKKKITAYQKEKKEEQVVAKSRVEEPIKSHQAPVSKDKHIVKKGDTLFSIAKNNGLTTQELIKLNHLPANGAIQLGQTLKLK
ncbi:MAG TPA: glucosaminidase domain-containing protein [Edaphocola sp.]|nr:glucosaminidase domain-containing protein [Edaphocola sp.]